MKLWDYIEYHGDGAVGRIVEVHDGWNPSMLVRFAGGGGCTHDLGRAAAKVTTDPVKIAAYEAAREAAFQPTYESSLAHVRSVHDAALRERDQAWEAVRKMRDELQKAELEVTDFQEQLERAKRPPVPIDLDRDLVPFYWLDAANLVEALRRRAAWRDAKGLPR